MTPTKVYVHLGYDAQTKSLPPEQWQEFDIHGLHEHHNPENEAIGFALETSELDHTEWPTVVFTTLQKPQLGARVTRHSLEVLPKQ